MHVLQGMNMCETGNVTVQAEAMLEQGTELKGLSEDQVSSYAVPFSHMAVSACSDLS